MSSPGRPDLPSPGDAGGYGGWTDGIEWCEPEGEQKRRPWTPEMRAAYRAAALAPASAELYPATYFSLRLREALSEAHRQQWPLAVVVLQIAQAEADDRRRQALEIALRLDVREDDLPARLDDTTFAVLLPRTDATAAVVAARLQRALTNITGQPVAAGIALYPDDATTPDELMQIATHGLMVGPEWEPKPEF